MLFQSNEIIILGDANESTKQNAPRCIIIRKMRLKRAGSGAYYFAFILLKHDYFLRTISPSISTYDWL